MKRLLVLLMAFVMIVAATPVSFAKSNQNGGNSGREFNSSGKDNSGRGFENRNKHSNQADLLHEMGLLDGVNATIFDPALDEGATRAEAIKMIGTALGWSSGDDWDEDYEDLDEVEGYDDVPAWAAPYVAFALDNNITRGIGRGQFGSDLPVTLKMVYTWYYRALLFTEDSWNNPEFLVEKGLVTQDQYDDIMDILDDGGTLRDSVIGIMFDSLKWKSNGSDMRLIQKLVRSRWVNESVARECGLLDDIDRDPLVKNVVVKDADTIVVTFSEAMYMTTDSMILIDDAELVDGNDSDEADFDWNAAKTVLTLSLNTALPAGTYDFDVKDFEDLDENEMADYSTEISFAVETVNPTVTRVELENKIDFEDTTPSAIILVTFSEKVDGFVTNDIRLRFDELDANDENDFDDIDLDVDYDGNLTGTIELVGLEQRMAGEKLLITFRGNRIYDLADPANALKQVIKEVLLTDD